MARTPWHAEAQDVEEGRHCPGDLGLEPGLGKREEYYEPRREPAEGFGPFPTSRHACVFALGLAAVVCFVLSLTLVRPFTAAVTATLAWLCWYVYWLQSERDRLQCRVNDAEAQATEAQAKSKRADFAFEDQPGELDVTGFAKVLGIDLDDPVPKGSSTLSKVLTVALVKEYLRCVSELQRYQARYGPLKDGAGPFSGSAVLPEALLTGLGLMQQDYMPSSARSARPPLPVVEGTDCASNGSHPGQRAIRSAAEHAHFSSALSEQRYGVANGSEQSMEPSSPASIQGPPSPEQRRRQSRENGDDRRLAQLQAGNDAPVAMASTAAPPSASHAPSFEHSSGQVASGEVPRLQQGEDVSSTVPTAQQYQRESVHDIGETAQSQPVSSAQGWQPRSFRGASTTSMAPVQHDPSESGRFSQDASTGGLPRTNTPPLAEVAPVPAPSPPSFRGLFGAR